ncbi:MAG: two-component regulator propeller domain-containing protein [Bacteroidota bacterium]
MLTRHTGNYLIKFLCSTAVLGLFNMPVSAQSINIKFKHITGKQGLSNSTIETIYQDSRGYIWFGTRDGLNQFDGSTIKVFRNIANDTGSISDNYIRSIGEDAGHHLWIGTINGLNKFDPYKNTFTRYKHDASSVKSLSGNGITCIYKDKKGNLWVGTEGGGLNLYNEKQNGFRRFHHTKNDPASLPGDEVNCLFEDRNHRLWIGTDKGLCLFNTATGTFSTTIKLDGSPDIQLTTAIVKIQEDKQGNLWLGTFNDGVMMIARAAHRVKQFRHDDKDKLSLSTDQVRSLLADNEGWIWVGGINGSLDRYRADKGDFEHAQNDPANALSLSQKTLSAIFEDNQHNLWVGTHRGGINVYTPLADKFQLVQQGANVTGLSYNDVKSFYQDHQNNIWIGTDGGGLNLFNPADQSFQHFKYNVYNGAGISSDAVLSINEDRYNNLWVGTWGGGLDLMDRTHKTFQRFVNHPAARNSISSNFVQTTLEDSEGNFWVATYYGGLNLFDVKTKKFTRITGDAHQQSSIYGNNVVSLNEDQDKNLWIGTDDGGLNCYNLITKQFTHYFVNGEKTPDIRAIFTDSKGRVWVGQTGLYLFNKAERKFQSYTVKGGLSTEFIKSILEDEKGNLWIATSNGLTRFNPDTYDFKKYNMADGLQGLEFEAGASMKTHGGEMYFGGINGFNKFYPRDIKLNQFEAPVYITNLQVLNKTVLPGQTESPLQNDISLTHQVTLDHLQSTVSFQFAILDYTAPDNNQYAYKLDNFDKAWHYNNTEGKANYTNLDPGHYTFYVKASNNDGVWNHNIAYVNIDILPPFWATWWFRFIVILLVVAITYFLLRFKKNLDMQKIEENKREELHNMQLQFFTNISHEFRTPLSLILGPLEKMMDQDNRSVFHQYYDTIHRNANRLLLLINELMDFRKAETGALKLKVMPGNMNIFIAEVAEDFRNLAMQKQIRLSLVLGQDIGEAWFDRQILEKIILNLMDNAFKYTKVGGDITIELYTNPAQFVSSHEHEITVSNSFRSKKQAYIRVSDNGVGISQESISHLFERYYRTTDTHMGSGVGLAFVKSLTLLHKGNISVHSKRNVGTDFIISLPVDRDDYLTHEKWITNSVDNHVQLESISAPIYQTELREFDDEVLRFTDTEHLSAHYKILVVDDNDELRNFLDHSLNEFYEIIEATDGLSGLTKAREEMPDLIISDLMMPEMDGIEFCRHIKTEQRTNQIPFIILSAKDAIESKIEGADSGADLYFPKPVNINLLLLSIKNIFEQRKILKERYLKNYFVEAQEITDSLNDKEFMDRFIKLIESQLSNSDMDVDYLCREMGMSKTKLYHKIKGISGQSIGEFVRTFRLKKAAYIITHEDVLLTDAMYRVGIQTQSYFTKAFKKEFGKTPSQFLQEIKNAVAEVQS